VYSVDTRMQKLKFLTKLDLEGNDLSSGIPSDFFNSCKETLVHLNLSDCKLKDLPER